MQTNSAETKTEYIRVSSGQIQEWQEECHILVSSMKLSDRRILTLMGLINAFTWRAAVDYGVYAIKGKSKERWQEEFLGRLLSSDVSIHYALTPLIEYLKTKWGKAFHSQHTIERWRLTLKHCGLYDYDTERRRGAKWGADNGVPNQGLATPPEMKELNIPKMVVWYHILYSILQSRMTKDELFDFMPEHGGMMMIDLYNLMFNGLADFRGNSITENPDIVVANTATPIHPKNIIWKWREGMGIARSMWRSLVRRSGEIVAPMQWRRTPWEKVQETVPY